MGRRKKRIWETWTDWDNESIKCNGCGTPTDYGQGTQVVDVHDKSHRLCWSCWKRMNEEMEEDAAEIRELKAAGKPVPPKQGTLF